MNDMQITPSSSFSVMKWWSISICLVLSCCTTPAERGVMYNYFHAEMNQGGYKLASLLVQLLPPSSHMGSSTGVVLVGFEHCV